MTEQFKLVTNAQESKIFKSNVTTIKIKCSHNFPRPYGLVWKLPTQAWSKAKVLPSGGHLGIFRVVMYRPGLQIGTPF